MTSKQEIVIAELLKGATITDACKTAKVSRNTYYKWKETESFQEELKNRKRAVLNECTQFLRSNFKEITETLLEIINSPESSSQVKINAIDSFFRSYKVISEEDALDRLDEIEKQLKTIEEMERND